MRSTNNRKMAEYKVTSSINKQDSNLSQTICHNFARLPPTPPAVDFSKIFRSNIDTPSPPPPPHYDFCARTPMFINDLPGSHGKQLTWPKYTLNQFSKK